MARLLCSGDMVSAVRPGSRHRVAGDDVASLELAAPRPVGRAGWAIALGLFALLLLGTALEFSRDRAGIPAERPNGASLVRDAMRALDAPVLSNPGVKIPLAAEAAIMLDAGGGDLNGVLSDDRGESGIWSVDSKASSTTLRRLAPDRGPALRLPTAERPDSVDVAEFSSRVGLAATLVYARPDGSLHIDVWRLSGTAPSVVGRYDTPALQRPAASQRTVMLGHWAGPRADLYVLDRAGRAGDMQVRVLSGEAGFRSMLLSVIIARGNGFDRREWGVDLQDLAGSGRSDIVFTSRTRSTGSGRIEVHALAAQTNFSRYLLQLPTSRSAAEMAGHRALAIRRQGQAQWLLVDVATGVALPHPLVAAPLPPRSP